MKKEEMFALLDSRAYELKALAKKIWQRPELALEEVYASTLQKEYLTENGFEIKDVNGLPTAFFAEYGTGHPVIGILGEYDALPGLSQKAETAKEAEIPGANGHGCGHNLIGMGGIGAALAVKDQLEKGMFKGTIKYFGCPAEEKFGGKKLMLDAGAFDGVDCCLSWHPESVNKMTKQSFRAICDVNYRFHGTTSHSVAERELGKNAVNGLDMLNIGVKYLCAQMNDSYLVDGCVLKSAETTNVLPEVTEVTYCLRADDLQDCRHLVKRIHEIADGAALISGTTVDKEITGTYYSDLYNAVIGELVYDNMIAVPRPEYSDDMLQFAEEIARSLGTRGEERTRAYYHISDEDCAGHMHIGAVKADKISYKPSSDVGNVSWHMPVGMFFAAAGPVGMPMHTWQATALCGSEVGFAAMLYASKVLSATVFDLMNRPELLKQAWSLFREATEDVETGELYG